MLAETKGKTPFQFRSFQMVISGVSVKALDILVSDLTMSTCQNEIEFDLPVVSHIYIYKYGCAEKSLQYLNIADDRNN